MRLYYEFFAGGGMVRAGLDAGWTCAFANDIDQKKAATYARNWGASELRVADVATLKTDDLPGVADLAWGSFPCQDLSQAGVGAGLRGNRSGTFWPFWKLMQALVKEGRAPKLITLENVCGALTSHGGRDFATIGSAIVNAGYRFGALVIDAVHFVPQSRPRLFIIAVHENQPIPEGLAQPRLSGDVLIHPDPCYQWSTRALLHAQRTLSEQARGNWLTWRLPLPSKRRVTLSSLIDDDPSGVRWHTFDETSKLLSMMSRVNLDKVEAAKRAGRRMIGTIYKRTRLDQNRVKTQRAEIRFDDISGCLRTPTGGSSRQTIMVIDGTRVRSRLMSPREAARLMGLSDDYQLPENYNEGYHLAGDGVVAPVVRHIAENILEPILSASGQRDQAA